MRPATANRRVFYLAFALVAERRGSAPGEKRLKVCLSYQGTAAGLYPF
jgi:hypothetical protein